MSDLKRYDVVINGMNTTLQLNEQDAKARGLGPENETTKQAAAPRNKARTATTASRRSRKAGVVDSKAASSEGDDGAGSDPATGDTL